MKRPKASPTVKKPSKNEDIKGVVTKALADGRYRFGPHALQRMTERRITQMDIMDILTDGRRERAKDKYDEVRTCWKYAWRGKDEDRRELRVIVAEKSPGIIIITAIDLDCGA